MNTAVSAEKAHYNKIAIKTCREVTAARAAMAKQRNQEALRMEHRHGVGWGVALEYERMGSRPVSEGLQARADEFGFELEHLGITLGTVIHNINLKGELTSDLIQFVRDTLNERKVIFFRDQHLTEDEQVAFGRSFGELDAFPFAPAGENPYIVEVRAPKNSPGGVSIWHTDVTWMEKPSLGSILQLIVVPPIGGETLFSDSHAAYLGMPHDLRQRIKFLHGINDYRAFLAGLQEELVATIKEEIPFGVSHPLVRTHPETGKTALYINVGFLRHDSLYDVRNGEQLEREEAEKLVKELLSQHNRPEYMCRFPWQEGSIAFWDNRAVQHYAASNYYPHARLGRRITVAGDKPYYDPEADAAYEAG